jgi:hypothetical protein
MAKARRGFKFTVVELKSLPYSKWGFGRRLTRHGGGSGDSNGNGDSGCGGGQGNRQSKQLRRGQKINNQLFSKQQKMTAKCGGGSSGDINGDMRAMAAATDEARATADVIAAARATTLMITAAATAAIAAVRAVTTAADDVK